VFGPISGLRYARESFIAAKVEDRILAPFCYQGTCNAELFNMWLKDFLIPELKPGQVVILDNASFHKSKESKSLIEAAGCKVLFLPAYSPDLNPIEIFWANFKKMVQINLEKINTLAKAIDFSFLTVLRTEKNQI
jgi:transposase